MSLQNEAMYTPKSPAYCRNLYRYDYIRVRQGTIQHQVRNCNCEKYVINDLYVHTQISKFGVQLNLDWGVQILVPATSFTDMD